MTPCPVCETPLPQDAAVGNGASLGVCTSCFNPVLIDWQENTELAQPLAATQDMRRVAPEGSIGATLLAHAGAGIEDLPLLPEISQRILALLKDPEFGMPDLAALIKEDPVLAVAIMKQANSAAFGGLHEIKDLNGACTRLGMKTIANTVQLAANRNLFITGNRALKDNMERLWRHSVATAHCAHEIARLTLAPNQESVFLSGLIHDIGKVLLLELVANPQANVLQELQGKPELLREVMDGLHRLLGLLICQAWKLPSVFRAAVYFHHNPEQCMVKDWIATAHTISLANTIAKIEGYSMQDMTEEIFLASNPSSVHLGLSDIKLATLRVDLSDKLDALFEAAG